MKEKLDHGLRATVRHRSAWIEAGPRDGPVIIFLHGWPEIGRVWRHQLEHFASQGWRCIAPDMRGYGESSVHGSVAAYAVREIVLDMIELHDAVGGAPAVWVGHDWGSSVVWSIAAHHPSRCRGVANMCVPYLARGMTLEVLTSLVDRELYPLARFPVGQWDYWLYHREHFHESNADLQADVANTINALYSSGSPDVVGTVARTASIRAQGGWFGGAHCAPTVPRDERLLSEDDHAALTAAFARTGFESGNAWYLNDILNAAFASEAPAFGRIQLPALFLHAEWDLTCNTFRSRLADPMRADCSRLTEVAIPSGHEVMLERPTEVNGALETWMRTLGP